MQDLVIHQESGKKTRSFSATCVAVVTADRLFDESGGKTIRPVWAMFAGTEQMLRPFMANLRLGRKAEPHGNNRGGDSVRLEFLKGVGYQVAWQREEEGTLATIYHPDLFRLDPGMVDPTGINFVILTPADWAAQQDVDTKEVVDFVEGFRFPLDRTVLEALVPTAYLFAAYLDRRTRCPLIADGRFYLQLLCGALDKGLASFPSNNIRYSYGNRHDWGHGRHGFNVVVGGIESRHNGPEIADLNLLHAISFGATHEDFEEFLAQQVTTFFERLDGEFEPLTNRVDLSDFESAVA